MAFSCHAGVHLESPPSCLAQGRYLATDELGSDHVVDTTGVHVFSVNSFFACLCISFIDVLSWHRSSSQSIPHSRDLKANSAISSNNLPERKNVGIEIGRHWHGTARPLEKKKPDPTVGFLKPIVLGYEIGMHFLRRRSNPYGLSWGG